MVAMIVLLLLVGAGCVALTLDVGAMLKRLPLAVILMGVMSVAASEDVLTIDYVRAWQY